MTPNKLLLHPKTKVSLETYLANPFHFLLIQGLTGAGKTTLALYIANQLLDAQDLKSKLHILKKSDDRQQISIDDIRRIISKLKLKATGNQPIKQVFIIEDAQFLSEEAQNALLKTLEEPPIGTIIIGTVDSIANLLPTIASRSQIINMNLVLLDEAISFFGADKAKIKNAWLLSEGAVGLMSALLDQDKPHVLKEAVENAKSFIQKTRFERLSQSDKYTKDKQKLVELLEGLSKVIKAAQKSSIINNKNVNHAKLIKARKLVADLRTACDANVSPRLIYMRLGLKLNL